MALGEAQVKIVPDLSGFKAELVQGINEAMREASRTVDQAGEKIESAFTEAAAAADRALKQVDGDGFTSARLAADRAGAQIDAEMTSAARQADDALSRVDGDGFKEARESADKAGKEIGDSLETGAKTADNAFANFAKGAGFAALTAAVGRFAKSSIDAYADLGETLSKAGVIFGDATDSVVQFGDQAAESLGQSKQAAIAAAADFAIFGGAAGLTGEQLATFSTDLTALASDLASFSNTTPEEAVLALGAALRGESEPIRRYGVLLDEATLKNRALEMGIYDGTGSLTQQQRVLAANAEIFAQTGLAQGDFARTSDSLANSQKTLAAQFADLQVTIGEALAPAMSTAVSIGGDLLGLFSALPDALQGVIAVAGIATVGFVAASNALQSLGIAASTANKALGIIGVAVAGATAVYSLFSSSKKEATKATEELTAAILEERKGIKGATDDYVRLKLTNEDLVGAADTLGISLSDIANFIRTGVSPSFEELTARHNDLRTEAVAVDQIQRNIQEAFGLSNSEVVTFINTVSGLRDEYVASEAAAGLNVRVTEDLGIATEETKKSVDEYKAALDVLERQTKVVSDAIAENRERVMAWRDSLIDATQNGSESFNTFEVEATTSIAQFRQALLDSAQNVFDWQNNLLTIAQQTSPEFASYLADMGVAGAQLVAALAKNETELQTTFDAFVLNAATMNRDFLAEFDQTPAGVQRRMDDVKAAVNTALGPLADDMRTQALAISDALMQGLVEGIQNGQTNLAYAAAAMANTVLVTSKDALGIRSPSQVFRDEVGAPIAQGVADGITATVVEAKDAMGLLVNDLTSQGAQAVDDFNVSLKDALSTAEDAFKEAWSLVQGRRSQEQQTQRVTDAEGRLATAQQGVIDATNAVSAAQAELLRVQSDSTASARDVEQAQRGLANAQRDLDRAQKEVTAATKSLQDANFALLQSSEDLLSQGPESVANFEAIAKAAGLESGEIQTLITRYNELTAARNAAAEAAKNQANIDRELADLGRRSAVDQANEAVRQARARRDEVVKKGGNVAAAERDVAQAAIKAADAFAQASGATAGSRAFAKAQLDVLRFLVAESPWLSDDLAGIMKSLSGMVALADGAVVRSPTIAMVGEAGDEAVIPLGRPARALALMEQTGLGDLARANSGAIVNIQNATFATPSDADLVAQKVNAAYRARVLVG